MSGLSGTLIIAIVAVVFIAVLLVGMFLYLLQTFRNRKAKLRGELDAKPELIQDRAFNRLAMARREAGILAGQGLDVHRAQELIAEAQGAFDTHQYDRSYQVSQSAHEALVNARSSGTRLAGASSTATSAAAAPSSPAPAAAARGSSVSPAARPTMPKNRAESQFQIHLLGEEIDGLPSRRARDPVTKVAADLRSQASAAFDRGDFTEAFRLALRGRRTLGSTLETLPPTGAGTTRSSGAAGNGNAPTSDVAQAEAVAGAERCPDCGNPTLAGEPFCRGCGRPLAPMTCPSCGSPRTAEEPFCAHCGTRFP